MALRHPAVRLRREKLGASGRKGAFWDINYLRHLFLLHGVDVVGSLDADVDTCSIQQGAGNSQYYRAKNDGHKPEGL